MKNFLIAVLFLFVLSISAFASEPLIIREQGIFSAGGTVYQFNLLNVVFVVRVVVVKLLIL